MEPLPKEIENQIQAKAIECGFELFGITKAELPIEDKENLNTWIEKKLYGKMDWYPKNNDLRINLKNLGFTPKSVVVLGVMYQDREYEEVFIKKDYKISRYAIGSDYHKVLRNMAKPFLKFLKEKFPENSFRQGVDSLPVPEKIFAREAGIGWQGKNTNIINENLGSYFFISVILTDLQLLATSPATDRCGTCRACLDACPTGALFEPYKIDAGKCISHNTIEDRSDKMDLESNQWVYGCDICQEVCPWNRIKARKRDVYTTRDEFKIREEFKVNTIDDFLNMTEEAFQKLVKDSAMDRISYSMFQRNLKAVKEE